MRDIRKPGLAIIAAATAAIYFISEVQMQKSREQTRKMVKDNDEFIRNIKLTPNQ